MNLTLQSTYVCRLDQQGQVENLPTSLKPLDRLVILIPQSKSLYRELSYEREYVSKAELEECIDNDLNQISPWPSYHKYYLTYKADDVWLVTVWIWPELEVPSATHVMPEMAYKLGCLKPGIVLCWQDGNSLFSALRQANGLPSRVWDLSQHHLQRRFTSWLEQDESIEGVVYDGLEPLSYIDLPIYPSAKSVPDFSWLKAGQNANAIDISSPWGLRSLWSACLTLLTAWVIATYGLIYWQDSQLETSVESGALQLQQLQRQRAELNLNIKRTEAIQQELTKQQALTHSLDALAAALPKTVVLSRIAFKDHSIELEATADTTNGLLEAMEQIENVNSAKFISDIVQTREGKQRFSLELTLERAAHVN
ncbi:PilN domain-containing protein [Motilimonas sp. KMU-193]|uniref:PilN domain-containing protein n=1 Tax=Motilimonas sp. KMU-193 TaxID=3388668 RepID=UPI00396B249B